MTPSTEVVLNLTGSGVSDWSIVLTMDMDVTHLEPDASGAGMITKSGKELVLNALTSFRNLKPEQEQLQNGQNLVFTLFF
jgi:hypothetical protein